MAADMNRNIVIGLLFAIAVVAYFYWTAASSVVDATDEVVRVTAQLTVANRTIDELRREAEDLQAKINAAEEDKKKAATAAAAETAKRATEKTALEAKIKTETDNAKVSLEQCQTACENKVKEAKSECPTRILDKQPDAVAPVVA